MPSYLISLSQKFKNSFDKVITSTLSKLDKLVVVLAPLTFSLNFIRFFSFSISKFLHSHERFLITDQFFSGLQCNFLVHSTRVVLSSQTYVRVGLKLEDLLGKYISKPLHLHLWGFKSNSPPLV